MLSFTNFGVVIAALTGAGCRAGKRSLHVRCPVSGQVPCSGARRRGKVLDEVSAAIPGDAVAGNKLFYSFRITPCPMEIFRALCNDHLLVVFALANYRFPLSQSNYVKIIYNLLTFFSQPFISIIPYIMSIFRLRA